MADKSLPPHVLLNFLEDKYHPPKQPKDLLLSKVFPVRAPAEFISILKEYTAFKDTEKQELMRFQDELGLFDIDGKNIIPLGRVGTKTYYVHIQAITPGSANDDKHDRESPLRNVSFHRPESVGGRLLVIGRLIAGELQTYWIIAMDSDHELYALRALQIGPDEEYDDDEEDFEPFINEICLKNQYEADESEGSAESGNVYDENTFDDRTQSLDLDKQYDSDGSHNGEEGSDESKTDINNDTKIFKIPYLAILSQKHDKNANVFDATDAQLVFDLGPLDLLSQGLKNHDQEIHPKPLSDILSWESTPITSF